MEEKKQSFWNHGIGKTMRSLFVLGIVYVPAYFAGDTWGGKGLIGCIIVEFVLLVTIFKIIGKMTSK